MIKVNVTNINNISCIVIFAFLLTILSIIAIWTDRTLDFWCTYFKGEPIDVPFWISLIVTWVFSGIIFAINIISEVIRLIV